MEVAPQCTQKLSLGDWIIDLFQTSSPLKAPCGAKNYTSATTDASYLYQVCPQVTSECGAKIQIGSKEELLTFHINNDNRDANQFS